MPELHALPQQISQALEKKFTILTANQRAARTLVRAFDLQQRTEGRSFWEPPAIISWDSWLAQLWRSLLVAGKATELLLNQTQEQTLWRNIIKSDAATASLRPVDALAQTAADAWRLLHQYCGRADLTAMPGNADTRAFARWVSQFERRAAENLYLTQAQLPEVLRVATGNAYLDHGPGLLLVGFDSRTPAQNALLDAIRASGTQIEETQPSAPSQALSLAPAASEQHGLEACAVWIRAYLEQHPQRRVAVIVPGLEEVRAAIERTFRNIIAPELNHAAEPAGNAPFEFSLGVPLARTALAASAVDILRWAAGPLPVEAVSALLLSPHFAGGATREETLARAEFDAAVIHRLPLLQPELSWDDILLIAARSAYASRLPVLLSSLQAQRPAIRGKNSTAIARSHSEWAAAMHALLEAVNWALPPTLDSVEFQTRKKWEASLDNLATLDFEATRVPFGEALNALLRILSGTLFAPESQQAPVQIMGPLESAGSSFDAIWCLRADDLTWPARSSPSPLLPWLLQRKLGMPGADLARDMALSRRITERIAGSAAEIIFSYAKEGEAGPQRPSPALSALNLRPCDPSILLASPPRRDVKLEEVEDNQPIPPPSGGVLHGGASVLQAQAACGFRAFAEGRLFSTPLDSVTLGLDAGERGSIVHAVLERFWAEVRTQAALKAMTPLQRSAELSKAIDIALARNYSRPAAGWPTVYLKAERQRILNLLLPWLELEANSRAPFTVLAQEERLAEVQIGQLRLSMRVDRIDEVQFPADSGKAPVELILDYKTGAAAPSSWLSDRPDEPQLPLYAVVTNRPRLGAIAFASLRPGEDLKMMGFQSEGGIFPNRSNTQKDTFANYLQEWRRVLNALADSFCNGEATVSPKKFPETCKYCEQRLLCRLDPASLNSVDLEEDNAREMTEADLG